jgi:Ca2+-binding EF-hand superfamily protein
MRLLSALLLLGAATLSLAAEPPADKEPLELLWLHPARPYRLQMHLRIDNTPAQQRWEAAIHDLFRFLDVNGDGVLSKAETACAPSPAQWLLMLQGSIELEPDAAPDFDALPGKGETIRSAQLRGVYQRSGAGPLQVQWGRSVSRSNALSEALFTHLDQDRDGKLSRAELQVADRVLNPLDSDGDEMITAGELSTNAGFEAVTVRPMAQTPVPDDFSLLPWGPKLDGKKQAERMIARYDRSRDHRLDRKEIGLPAEAFAALDRNRDGFLEAALQLGGLAPDFEAVLPLRDQGPAAVQILRRPSDLSCLQERDGSLRLNREGQQMQIFRVWGTAHLRQVVRKPLEEQFRRLDRNKDGILDGREIHQPPFTFVAHLRLADRDGDNRLSRKELAAYLDLVEKVVVQSTFITLVDRGQQLFTFIDGDQDGRLSQRELRSAWARLAPLYPAGKEAIGRDEMPHSLQVILSQGIPPGMSSPANGSMPAMVSSDPMALVRERKLGPLWFRKMDRNHDGDLSPREMLGTPEQFRALDADGDGLIDVDEAEKADRRFRGQPSVPGKERRKKQ